MVLISLNYNTWNYSYCLFKNYSCISCSQLKCKTKLRMHVGMELYGATRKLMQADFLSGEKIEQKNDEKVQLDERKKNKPEKVREKRYFRKKISAEGLPPKMTRATKNLDSNSTFDNLQ